MTICAISTPAGTGGIAVARLSGPQAFQIADNVWRGKPLSAAVSHTAHLGTIVDPADGQMLDSAVATVYRAPASFTGDDTVEFSIHGSPWIQRELIQLLIRQGARMALPGEFTRRAFAAGKLDLAEAEAVADMIASSSRAAHRIATAQLRGHYSQRLARMRDRLIELCALLELELDFSEEDVEFAPREQLITLATDMAAEVHAMASSFSLGNALKNGVPVAIVGATNAGKSTLLNRILGEDKAIVSDIHGTTRDVIEDTVELGGTLLRLIDTAGLRHTTDPIERIGIERSLAAIDRATVILWIIDPTDAQGITHAAEAIRPHLTDTQATVIAVINKADLGHPDPALPSFVSHTITLSALTDTDLTPLTGLITRAIGADTNPADLMVTNARHYEALTHTLTALTDAVAALRTSTPADLIAPDLRLAIHHLSTITGTITTPDILSHIFSRFCIGK